MFVGIDIGTSAVKAILVDDDDRVIAEQSAPLSTDQPRPLWSEQSPETWWSATESVLERLAASHGNAMQAVRALGLTGQMLGVTLVDAAERPLRKALLWNDGRAIEECRRLERDIPDFARLTGCRAMPGFSAPKLMWLARHEPAQLGAARHILLTKDYVRLKLTGESVTDRADASATLLMDTRAGSWSSVIAETCGVAIDRLPRLCASGEPSATLRGSFARRFGMRDDVLVAGGAGDNMCAALGAGVIDSGDACISLGTSAVYLVANAAYVPALGNGLHTHRHAVADRFVQQGCVLSAASALVWLCRTLSIDDAADFVARIEAADHSPDDVPVFTPYLAGERTPHNDPLASATMSRMRVTTGPLELGRAVLDGVGLALADCQDALVADHAAIERIALIGGGARSRVWGEIIASAIGRTLYVPAHAGVGAALGAARLARQAVGGPLIADAATREVRHIVPRTNWIEAYRRKREIFRRHYAALDRGTSLAS